MILCYLIYRITIHDSRLTPEHGEGSLLKKDEKDYRL